MSLEPSRTRTFEDIADAFTQQYDYNSLLDVTLRELELTKQEEGESFSKFLTRWRAKAAQMVNRPSEREQIVLIKKNLQPHFRKTLGPIPMATFRDLLDAGVYLEDEQQEGAKAKTEGNNQAKGKKGNPDKAAEVHAAFGPSYHHNRPYQPYPPNNPTYHPSYPTYQFTPPQYATPTTSNYPRPTPSYHNVPPPNPIPEKRYLTPLGKPLSEVFSKLMRRGVLKPLDPRPSNLPLPPYVNANLYCDFHQGVGHQTDHCRRLQYAIQDLIDQKIIPPPQAPNITDNPLPNHQPQTNFISTNIPFDPSHYILPSTQPKPNVVIWEVKDICGNLGNIEEPQSAKGKDMCKEPFRSHGSPFLKILTQTKAQPDWSDILNGDLWEALFQEEPTKDQASPTLPKDI